MQTAVLTFSPHGLFLAQKIWQQRGDWEIFLHQDLTKVENFQDPRIQYFQKITELWKEKFHQYKNWVCIAPTGAVIRALAPLIIHKLKDPAVVVVDAGGRHVISLLSGHEGGANFLAVEVSNLLCAEPVIGTTTEAIKTVIAGIGCRKDTPKHAILEAIHLALEQSQIDLREVRFLATAEIKAQEKGLLEAAAELQIPLRIIPHSEIHQIAPQIGIRESVMQKVGLPGVAEPTALLAGKRSQLCLKRIAHQGVTVALARENCLWSESDQAASWIAAFGPFKV